MKAIRIADNKAVASQQFGAYLLNDFFAFLDVSEKTQATYQRALKQVFGYFAMNGINKPVHDDILNFKKSLEAAGRKPSTIALYLAACRRFFSWCEQRGICQNVATGVKAPKQERGHKRDFFGATQLKDILSGMSRKTLRDKRDYAIMALMTVGGLRTIEVSRANLEDIRNVGGSMILYVCGKGRKERTEFVKLPEPVLAAINDYLALRNTTDETAPLFVGTGNRNKGRLSTRTISGIAKQAMRAAGYNSRRLSAHSLRHSAVTLCLLGGMSLQDTQAFARHANIATTTVYAHDVSRLQSMCETTIANAVFA